ncbi:MAG: agmatine deiminase family protein [Pseudomonadota bacterium]
MSNVLAGDKVSGFSGYRMPEEAEPHERTFMQWPVSLAVYGRSYFLRQAQETIAEIANTIAEFEPVVMLMADEHISKARSRLSSQVEIWDIPTEDLWCRDSGPVFLKNPEGKLAVSQLNFNGWGGKQVHKKDGLVAERVAKRLGLPIFDNGLVGEGGGVESDGHGTLLAHESSWINPNRNKGDRKTVEQKLLEALGAEKVIWAPGIAGEDITDYHIDALARFVAPGKVLIQLPAQVFKGDIWSAAAYETYEIINRSSDASGSPIETVIIPDLVEPRIKSLDFVASYVNYYVCNGAVIAAQFGDRQADRKAFDTLAEIYPDREVIMMNVDALGEFGGGIHCATQQQPVSS